MVWSAVPWMWITEIGAGDGQGPSMVISIGARPPWGKPSVGSVRRIIGFAVPRSGVDPLGIRLHHRIEPGYRRLMPHHQQAGAPDRASVPGLGRSGQFLGHRGTPCLLMLLPAQPEEIADGVRLLIGPPSADRLPDLVDLEIVRIDLRARTIQVEGKPKVLPPAGVSLASTRA